MAKAARTTRTRLPRVATPSAAELRDLYAATYQRWLDEGATLNLNRSPDLQRALLLMADTGPADYDSKRLKAMYAVNMLLTKRRQQRPGCEVEHMAMAALLDLIGRPE